MKRLINFLIIAAVLAVLAWALLRGFRHKPEGSAHPPEAAGEAAEAHEDFVVKLEKEKWTLLALEMAEPEKATLKPQRTAFGRVLDPTPIATLDGDLASADAVLVASRAEYDRTQTLLRTGENTSRKVAEAAEAQFRADESKAGSLRRQALLQWGAAFSALDARQRRDFVEQLVHGESALVRVDLLPGDALTEQPEAARLLVLGREAQPVDTKAITPAADVDPKTQAQGFIVRVDKPPFPLRPGMALTAWLTIPVKERDGFSIPRSAVLRHDGRTWVFIQEEGEKFVRKPVTLDTPLDGDKGWFVAAEGGGIKADDLLVVAGAQALLSEELKASGGAAAEE